MTYHVLEESHIIKRLKIWMSIKIYMRENICLDVGKSLKETTSIPAEPSLSVREISNHTQIIKRNSVKTST